MTELLERARAALVLRDAIMGASRWEHVADGIRQRGADPESVRRLLAPKIPLDPHNHTLHSDGLFSYRQLVWWCRAVGLEAVGVTDHDNVSPLIADAIDEARALGVTLVPGLEFTVHRLGGQTWKGLEIGVHFLPAQAFAAFMRTGQGERFAAHFTKANRLKTEQAWSALEAVNQQFASAFDLPPIERDELWDEAGRNEPVCASALTVLLLGRIDAAGRDDLARRFPDTRAIFTHMNREGLVPPMDAPPRSLDDLAQLLAPLEHHGVGYTLTLNHPDEWLTKCGLTLDDGSPDAAGVRRLVALLTLHDPERLPFSFVELHTPRGTPSTRAFFEGLFREYENLQASGAFPLPGLQPIASTDSHRITGGLTAKGELRGWVPGEDFLFGLGALDEAHPSGSLEPPPGYPDAETLLRRMHDAARIPAPPRTNSAG